MAQVGRRPTQVMTPDGVMHMMQLIMPCQYLFVPPGPHSSSSCSSCSTPAEVAAAKMAQTGRGPSQIMTPDGVTHIQVASSCPSTPSFSAPLSYPASTATRTASSLSGDSAEEKATDVLISRKTTFGPSKVSHWWLPGTYRGMCPSTSLQMPHAMLVP